MRLVIQASLMLMLLAVRAQGQSLFNEITTVGIEFSAGHRVRLPGPLLDGELTPEQRTQRLEELAGKDGWEKYSRDSIVAPVTMEIDYVTDARAVRCGHNVHSAFVVHARFEDLADKDLMQQIFGKSEASADANGMKILALTEQELRDAGIPASSGALQAKSNVPMVEYSQVEFTLLEKIRLNGVIRMERTTRPGSSMIVWMLDPQFQLQEKWRGTWTKLTEADGSAHPYQGWGGYLSVTRLSDSSDVLLIESRMLLHELPEWFSASNFIRSKLPLAIQEGARNLRRKLKAR